MGSNWRDKEYKPKVLVWPHGKILLTESFSEGFNHEKLYEHGKTVFKTGESRRYSSHPYRRASKQFKEQWIKTDSIQAKSISKFSVDVQRLVRNVRKIHVTQERDDIRQILLNMATLKAIIRHLRKKVFPKGHNEHTLGSVLSYHLDSVPGSEETVQVLNNLERVKKEQTLNPPIVNHEDSTCKTNTSTFDKFLPHIQSTTPRSIAMELYPEQPKKKKLTPSPMATQPSPFLVMMNPLEIQVSAIENRVMKRECPTSFNNSQWKHGVPRQALISEHSDLNAKYPPAPPNSNNFAKELLEKPRDLVQSTLEEIAKRKLVQDDLEHEDQIIPIHFHNFGKTKKYSPWTPPKT